MLCNIIDTSKKISGKSHNNHNQMRLFPGFNVRDALHLTVQIEKETRPLVLICASAQTPQAESAHLP